MNLYLSGLLWVTGIAVVVAALAILFRRFGSDEERLSNNESAGLVFTIVGGLHAVVTAFVLISLLDTAKAVGDDSTKEANSMVAVNWAATSFPEPVRGQVQELTRSYIGIVLNEEWPKLRMEEDVDDAGWQKLDELRKVIADTPAEGHWLENRKTEAAAQLWEAYQARQSRLDAASGGVSTVMWFALILGAVMSALFPFLFGGPKIIPHIVIVVVLTAALTLLLFAIYQLENPFSGGVKVDPDAFSSALDRLR
ncbi:DUF4239 domain-containing protein [Crossiella sp. CA-258035]|uniref:bestrophin-like domain n=1 Tax=Crossiella sp. CA-258035 TaxID=2981138 RepID=UPI0024BD24C0|nr:DUF4239 domain-containing protein [Crossiella sp. CA-258035]WHT17846.1 DUF4239 domain-containing protein [Crossiella sp. CA-258035]